MKRRKFIYSLFSVLLFGHIFLSNKNKLLKDNKKKESFLNHIEIHVTEHCNLKCKYCSHFSSIAQEEYYNIKKYQKDIKRLSKITKGNIKNIQLLGGEPLLHPEINKIIKITRKYFPDSDIQILTNGTLLEKIKDDFWKCCHKNKIPVLISIYPINLNWDKIFKTASKHQVKIKTEKYRGTKLTKKNIEEFKIKSFYKISLDLKGKQNHIANFKNCSSAKNCNNFIQGKIYPCFVSSNIRHFNKKFNKNISITEKDYIDIYKIKNINEIINFLQNPTPFCKHCKMKTSWHKWEIGNQSIDEWT